MRIPSMGWMMIRCNSEPQFDHAWLVQKLECPVVALILHGSVQWRGTAQRITIPKNCNVDWENDDKTGYGVQYFRHIDFLYQKSVQRIWTRWGTLWPAGDILTSQAWEILKMDWYSSKIKHGKGRSPKKEGCWWWETYLGSGTIEYSLFEPPIHAEIQYFTRVSSFCFFRGKDCGSGTFSVVGPTWSKQFPAKIVSRQHNEWTSQAFVKKIIKSHIWLIYHDTYIYILW